MKLKQFIMSLTLYSTSTRSGININMIYNIMFSSLTNIKTLPLFRIRRVASTVACAWYIMFECICSCFDYNAMNDIVTTSFFIVTACKLKNSAQLNITPIETIMNSSEVHFTEVPYVHTALFWNHESRHAQDTSSS